MRYMQVLILSILIFTLACAPKNPMEEGSPKAKTQTSKPNEGVQTVTLPSLEDEAQKDASPVAETSESLPSQSLKEFWDKFLQEKYGDEDLAQESSELAVAENDKEAPSSPHLYEDVVSPRQVIKPEVPSTPARVGIGLAWFIGGFLVLHVGAKVENALFRLNAGYLKLVPTMASEELIQSTARLVQKFGLRQHVAEKLAARLIVTRSAVGLGAKRWLSRLFGEAIGLGKWVAPFMWGIGVMQIVLEPNVAGGPGDEIGPEERFEFLKNDIEALEKDPTDIQFQDRVIQSTVAYLYDFINLLESESNQAYIALDELKARKDLSPQDKETAQKEFEEFYKEQDSLIEYFKTARETLKEIYYVEGSDRSQAESILHDCMEKLQAILSRKK